MALVLSGWLYRELHPIIIFHIPQENKYWGKVSGINSNIVNLYINNHTELSQVNIHSSSD